MKWNDFLRGVQECQDDKLTERFGICDNFPILIRGVTLEKLREKLLATGRYEPHSSENDEHYETMLRIFQNISPDEFKKSYEKRLAFKQGSIVINFRNDVENLRTYGFSDDAQRVLDFQATHYNCGMMLHPYQKRKIPGDSSWRPVVTVIEDIVQNTLIPSEASFCIPRVFFYKKGAKIQDYSTIVYWPDSDEERMCKT
jgi:hypothetical protein